MLAERSHRSRLGACLAQVHTDRCAQTGVHGQVHTDRCARTGVHGQVACMTDISHKSGCWKAKVKVPVGWFPGGSFFPACRGCSLTVSCSSPRPVLCVCLAGVPSPSHRDPSYQISPSLCPHLISVTSLESLSPDTVTGGFGLQRVNLRGGQLGLQQAVRRCSVSPSGCRGRSHIPAPFDLSCSSGVTEWHLLCDLPCSVKCVMK